MKMEELPQLFMKIVHITDQCRSDLDEDTIKNRDSYYQIKAFHYDAIDKEIRKFAEELHKENNNGRIC